MAITANKLLGKKEKGGALAVRPTTSLVSYKGLGSSDTKKSESADLGKTLFTIQKKIILIDDLLKGTFAEKKKRQKDEVKQKEDEERVKQEKEKEKDKPDTGDEEDNKLVMPRLSFLDGIKNFISDVLVGWLTFNLIKFLPQIMKVLKILGPIADFLLFIGGKLLDGLVTLIDWGYKAVEGTRGFIENIFGEDGAKAFDNIAGHLNKLFNVIAAIALGVLAVGNQSNKQKQKDIKNRTKKKPKLKERYERRQKFKQQQKRIKRKKFFKKRTPKALRKTIQRGKITAKKFTRSLKKTPQKLTKSLSKNLGKTTKSLSKNLGKTTQAVSKNLGKVSGKISQSAGKIVTRLGMKMNTGMVQSMKGLSKMAKGVRIPVVGPIIAALTSYLADGKWDKALFIGLGTALGEMLGTAIPIPVIGTLLGGAIGYYIGDLLYTLFRGGGAGAVLKKLSDDIKKVLNVGAAVAKWTKKGFSRFYKGIPKLFIPDLPKDPPKWIPSWVPRKKFFWGLARAGIKAMLGPLNLLLNRKIPILPWLMNPFNTTPLLIKSFFSRDDISEKIHNPLQAAANWVGSKMGDKKKEEKKKKDDEKKTITTIDRSNQPKTQTLLESGKRGDIEQALYNMRISAAQGSGKSMSDWVGNKKYAGDVDLIMDHGLQNVIIESGRVTLKGNVDNILPLDVNSVAKKTNDISTYDEEEETVVIKPGSETGGDVAPETQAKESITPVVAGGGGGSREIDEALYKSG